MMKDQETLLPRFQCNIVVHTPYDGLREALKEMHKKDYSQVVIRVKGRLRFVTRDGLGRIMAEAWDDDYVDIKHPGIEDILKYEPTGTMVVMAGDRTVAEAADVLMQLSTPRVFAVVVTDSGDDRGQPLGIVTPDDLRRLRI
jgi:CBS domain-containing protein